MNQGRIWCVVSPNVGLPLMLGSVAVTSLIVHYSILSHTNWMSSYWAGSTRAKVAMEGETAPSVATITPPAGQAAFTITVTPNAGADKASPAFTITVGPNGGATTSASADDGAKEQTPAALALAAPQPK